jgi:hypothetical protein
MTRRELLDRLNPDNWKTHPEEQLDKLASFQGRVGWAGACLLNHTTGRLIDGHARVLMNRPNREASEQDREAWLDESLPVMVGEWPEQDEALVLSLLDPLGELAQGDSEQLEKLLLGLEKQQPDIERALADLAALHDIQFDTIGPFDPDVPDDEVATDEDAAPEPPKCPVTRRGDVWLLGSHVVLCGDSENAAERRALLCEEICPQGFDGIVTDPPYGLGIDGQQEAAGYGSQSRKGHAFREWDDRAPSPDVLFGLLQHNVPTAIFGGNFFRLPVSRGWIYWSKGQDGLLQSDGELIWTNQDKPLRSVTANRAQLHGSIHPTQKPVSVMRFVLDYVLPKDEERELRIFDPYLGSGSTLIAAEQRGDICFGIEREPAYVDAVVQRFEAFTGVQSRLFPSNQTFEQVREERHGESIVDE